MTAEAAPAGFTEIAEASTPGGPATLVFTVDGEEVLSEFARVMHEWDFAPFRQGKVRMPTLAEARRAAYRHWLRQP